MGFFSWCDAKTGISIPAYPYADLPEAASHVVVLLPNGIKIQGVYDGYGCVGSSSLVESFEEQNRDSWWGKLKMVRADHYNGETYNQLKKSKNCPHQGYFYPQEEKMKIIASLSTSSQRLGI